MNNFNQTSLQKLRENTKYGQVSLHPKLLNCINKNINEIIPIQNIRYTPYLSDEIDDQGWGCAWRSIQMVLSYYYDITPEFKWLFSFFGQKKILDLIYITMMNEQEIPNFLINSNYAPHQQINGWAEPFIGYLIFYYMGFKSKLFAINSYPQNANAPQEIFQTIYSFQEFKSFLQIHFNQEKSPIQIDDATYSMIIYNIQFDGELLILFIGDPHIYYIQNNEQKIGLYTVTIDQQGNQINNSIAQDQKQFYMYQNSYQNLHFNQKPWMATCIIGIDDKLQYSKETNLII